MSTLDLVKEDSYTSPREAAINAAKLRGLKPVYGNDLLILIDVDSSDVKDEVMSRLDWFSQVVPVARIDTLPSKTKGHYHIHVHLVKPIPKQLRYAFQATLGSDHKHEMLNLFYVAQGGTGECFLFEKEDHASSV